MTYHEMTEMRESCRDYDANRPVEREKLVRCLEAARLAPSACNSQPWKFYAVTEPKVKAAVTEGVQDMGMNKFVSDCPALVIVAEERPNASEAMGAKVKKQDFVSVDIGLAASQFCYQALEEGLSTCILGWLNEKKIRAALNLPEGKRIRLVLALGYARSEQLREKKRKPLGEVAEIIAE